MEMIITRDTDGWWKVWQYVPTRGKDETGEWLSDYKKFPIDEGKNWLDLILSLFFKVPKLNRGGMIKIKSPFPKYELKILEKMKVER